MNDVPKCRDIGLFMFCRYDYSGFDNVEKVNCGGNVCLRFEGKVGPACKLTTWIILTGTLFLPMTPAGILLLNINMLCI